MARAPFTSDPVDRAYDELAAKRRTRGLFPQAAAPKATPPQDPRTTFDSIASETGVPPNLIWAVDEAGAPGGEVDPTRARAAAQKLKQLMDKGSTPQEAIEAVTGNKDTSAATLERAFQIADDIYPSDQPATDPNVPGEALAAKGDSRAADVAKQLGGAVLAGTGEAYKGVARLAEAGLDRVGDTIKNAAGTAQSAVVDALGIEADSVPGRMLAANEKALGVAGDALGEAKDYVFGLYEQLGTAITEAGEGVQSRVNETTKEKIAGSRIEGDILKPSTWSFGENPSLEGTLFMTIDVFGRLAPVVAAGLVSGGAGAAVVGAGQSAEGGAQTAREVLTEAARTGQLQESTYFQKQLDGGATVDEATARTIEAGEQLGALFSAPVGAFGGKLTTDIVRRGAAGVAKGGLARRVAGGAAIGAVEEGSQEVAEGVAARLGASQTGVDIDLSADSFGNFVMGALAGGPMGAAGGVPTPADPAARQLPPPPLGLPAPAGPENGPEGQFFNEASPSDVLEGDTSLAPSTAPETQAASDPIAGTGDLSQPPATSQSEAAVPPGPLEAAAQLAPAPAPEAPEAPQRFPDMKPGKEILLRDSDGRDVPVVFLREEADGVVVRDAGEELFLTSREFDSAMAFAREPVKKPDPAPEPVAQPEGGALSDPALEAIEEAPPADRGRDVPETIPETLQALKRVRDQASPSNGGPGYSGAVVKRIKVLEDHLTDLRAAEDEGAAQPGPAKPQKPMAPEAERAQPDMLGGPDVPESEMARAEREKKLFGRIGGMIGDGRMADVRESIDGLTIEGTGPDTIRVKDASGSILMTGMFKSKPAAMRSIRSAVRKGQEDARNASAPAPAPTSDQDPIAEANKARATQRAEYQTAIKALQDEDGTAFSSQSESARMAALRHHWEYDRKGKAKAVPDYLKAMKIARPSDAVIEAHLRKGTLSNTQQGAVFNPPNTDDAALRLWSAVYLDEKGLYPFKGQFRKPSDELEAFLAAPQTDDAAKIEAEAAKVDPDPTDGQKEAGNYRKGHIKIAGRDVSIENPKGGQRSGTGRDGKKWSVTMPAHYGDIKGTVGADGDPIDIYVGEDLVEAKTVYVINQVDAETGKFDEHKVMYGFANRLKATETYDAGFNDGKGPQRRARIIQMSEDEFTNWLDKGDTTKPATAKMPTPPKKAEVKAEPAPSITADGSPQWKAAVKALRAGEEVTIGDAAFSMRKGKERELLFRNAKDGQPGRAVSLTTQKTEKAVFERFKYAAQVMERADLAPVIIKFTAGPSARADMAITGPDYDRGKAREHIMAGGKITIGDGTIFEVINPPTRGGLDAALSVNVGKYGSMRSSIDLSREGGVVAHVTPNMIDEAITDGLRAAGLNKAPETTPAPNAAADTVPAPEPDLSREAVIDPETPVNKGSEGSPISKPGTPASYGAGNILVTADRAAELRAKLAAKLKNQLNAGIDPEILAMGAELMVYHVEAGARSFAQSVKAIADDLGTTPDKLTRYARSWYNGARDMMEDNDVSIDGMDDPETVRSELAKLKEVPAADTVPPTESEVETNADSNVVQKGERQAGGDAAVGQQPGTSDNPSVAEGQPESGSPAGESEGTAPSSPRDDEPDVGNGTEQPQAGDAADGRPRKRGAAVSGAGSVKGKKPAKINYTITDPKAVMGGTPVVRFERNMKAIEAMNDIAADGRSPTADELQAMAGYTGWGSFGQELFKGTWERPEPKEAWAERDTWLRDHLGESGWKSAQRSIINAHYTDPPTVKAMWEMAERMGFKGGRVLEPSMGIGNFFGLMPPALAQNSELTGIELDQTTGGMAQLLYPDANIAIKGYEKSETPDGFYDMAIGNWPFAQQGPATRRYQKLKASLHDFFFAKALDQVRPGGLVIGITSAGTMDKQATSVRGHLAERAELVAAYRLPMGAFEEYAGTSVVTDIVILKKRDKPVLDAAKTGWVNTVEVDTPSGKKVRINEYFAKNPDNVLGTLDMGRGLYREAMTVDRPENFRELLEALPGRVPENVMDAVKRGTEERFEPNTGGDRVGSVVESDGKLMVAQGENLVPLEKAAKYKVKSKAETAQREKAIRQLVGLRRSYGALLDAERAGATDTEAKRKALKKDYKAFVKAHGKINDSAALKVLQRAMDPHVPSLQALERGDGKPAAIMDGPIVRAVLAAKDPSTTDAFIMARNETAVLDLDRVAELAKKPVADVTKELLDSNAIYRMPGGTYEVTDLFLSGNVRKRRAALREAFNNGENELEPSLEAIEKVIPADIPYYSIEAQMGAGWIEPQYYSQFIKDQLGLNDQQAESINISFTRGSWNVKILDKQVLSKPEATTTHGHTAARFDRIARAALNNETLKIWTRDGKGKTVLDDDATKAVGEKVEKLRETFQDWIWADTDRRATLATDYNEAMNAIALTAYDGSFLEFPGMALRRGDDPFSLRSHQANAIWRGIAQQRGLYAHEVGTGKTYTMAGIAVESRRYGLARKPMLVAHNANSATVAKEVNDMYPGASVLYVDNLSPKTIDRTLASIRNDDWDVVVVPHSVLDRLSLSPETLEAMAAEEIRDLEAAALEAAQEDNVALTLEDMDDPEAIKKLRSPTAKEMVKARQSIINRIEKDSIRASRENAVTFEDLGIDMLLIDEGHEFKKPPFATKMSMKGLNTSPSAKSVQLQFLTRYIRKLNGGKGVHVFTGTPITNTLPEMYHQMRYVMEDVMAEAQVDQWDSWFNTFAAASTELEFAADGQFEPVTRLSSFVNVADLRRMAGEYLDIVFADDMPEFEPRATASGKTMADDLTMAEREELENGRTEDPKGRPYKKIVNDVAEMSPAQIAIQKDLAERYNEFRKATKKDRMAIIKAKADNPLSRKNPLIIGTEADQASLDIRIKAPERQDHENSKANRAVRTSLKHYNEDSRATQVIFMDKGYTNTATLAGQKVPALNLAKDIRDKLIKGGVKESEIVIVDGKVSKERRAMIAEMMNRSEVRIVIGQTQTLGVGVNMQENLRAMHHLDAPWMPGELEQRNGRGQRQGNKWNTVMEYRYITERIDGRRWQLLVTKARFIHDFMRADMSLRVIDSDISDESQSTSADDVLNTLSDAAGDPRIMQIQQITAKKEKLERRKATFTAGITEQANLAGKLEKKTVPKLKATLKDVAADAAHVKALRESDAFSATIDGQTYDKRADAIEALDAFLEANPTPDTQRGPQPIPVEVQGFSVLREKGYWRGDEYMIRRAGDHTVGKPTIASMESNMRKLSTRQAELTEDIAQKEASIGRLRDAADQDFPQEEQLARTTARLDALEADLEANPIPSPGWLRYGAEVDTKIHVDGKERVVTGHRWDNDGFFVLTEDGDVPYKDVTDATGQRVYEDQDHTPPTAPDRDPDPKASPKNEPKKPQNFLASESGAARLPSGDFVQDLKAKGSDILNNAAKQPSDILTDLMAGRVIGSALSFVPGRKLFKDMAKRLPSAGTYQRAKEEMDALRNDWQGKTAEVSDAWLTLNGARGLLTVGGGITPKIRRERRKAQADNAKLMDLMHRATLAGVDPSLPLTANKAYDAHSKSNSRKSWSKAKAAQIETTWRLLRKELDDLGPEHSSLFRKVAAQYDEMGDDFEKAVIQNIKKANELAVVRAKRAHKAEMRRIKDEGLKGKDAADAKSEADAKLNRVVERGGWAVKSRINGLRKEFESNRLDGPYFPLARFGDYFVTVRDDDGKVTSFSRFEKRSQQRKFADEMKKTGQDVQTGVITDTGELKSQVDPNFLADVQGLLGDYDVPGELMDAVWQRWLETLPDHSIRTSQIHRKGRAGFAPDALRAFTSHMFHGAHQLARLKYGLDLEEAMDNARLEAAVDKDPERAGLVVNEMQKRHDFTMNPTGAAWTAAATSTAFVWYLGATPAAAMVNLTQTTVVGPAVMGAKFAKQGATGALKELGRATKDLSSNIASDVAQKAGSDGWPDTLTQDEREALEEAYRRGTIDKTQAHDVASVAETGIEYSPTRERVMRKVSWMFHNAEVANRSITFLAAYRMARNDGQRDVDAVETAANLTWDTHFDYQASSRPRFMQGDVARVVTTFRQFTVNMLYIMARGAHQSFKAETPELRREARYQLAGITMSMLAHAGIKGVWGYGIISFILGQFVGDDEDETAKAAFDTWLQDALLVEGETLGATSWNFIAGMALNGVPGHATGINLSERLGMPNLWFRDSNRIEDGEEWYTRMVTEALGPVFGIGAGFARGAKYASDGDYWRGVETAVPKVIRDAMKAGRYANEGVLTRRNEDPIMESVNFGHVFKQLMGFTSADIAERYESNSRMMNKQKQIVSRRSGIQRDIVSAILKGTKPTEETWARMREFNKQYPEYPITGDTIRRSAAGRVRSKQRNEFGVQLNPRLNRRLREAEPKGIYIN